MKVILISGHARSGKDTVAHLLNEALRVSGVCGGNILITHYADLLKYICKTYFDWNGSKDEKGRTLLQYVGTDVIRAKDPDFWVDFLIRFLSALEDRWAYVIIPDARFPNEIEKFRQSGFNTTHIRITRPEADASAALTDEQKRHSSETSLDDAVFDMHILNDGDMADLRMKCIKCAKEILNAQKEKTEQTQQRILQHRQSGNNA